MFYTVKVDDKFVFEHSGRFWDFVDLLLWGVERRRRWCLQVTLIPEPSCCTWWRRSRRPRGRPTSSAHAPPLPDLRSSRSGCSGGRGNPAIRELGWSLKVELRWSNRNRILRHCWGMAKCHSNRFVTPSISKHFTVLLDQELYVNLKTVTISL